MGRWFVRFCIVWAVHFVAQTTFVASIAWYFGWSEELNTFLRTNRGVAAFFLVVHYVQYLLAEVLSVDATRLRQIERDRLAGDE